MAAEPLILVTVARTVGSVPREVGAWMGVSADAVRGTIELDAGEKTYRLNEETAVLVPRPRGWHLVERHVLVDGEPVSASLFDFGLAVAEGTVTRFVYIDTDAPWYALNATAIIDLSPAVNELAYPTFTTFGPAVPEPTAMATLSLAGVALRRRRRPQGLHLDRHALDHPETGVARLASSDCYAAPPA